MTDMELTEGAVVVSDRAAEKIGELDEARFKPAPDEIRAQTEQALADTFPDPGRKGGC